MSEGLPHSVELEEGVLGACVLKPDQVVPYCIQKGIKESVFFVERNQVIWRGIQHLYNEGMSVEEVNLATYLDRVGELERLGGIPGVNRVLDRVETASWYEDHVRQVLEFWQHREFLKKNMALRDVLEQPKLFEELRGEVRTLCTEINNLTVVEDDVTADQEIASVIDRAVKEFEGTVETYGPHTIYWPWATWNEKFGPLDPDQGENFLYVLGGYASEGKSSISRQVVWHNLRLGKRALCFQLEGNPQGLYSVMASQMTVERTPDATGKKRLQGANTKVDLRRQEPETVKEAYLGALKEIESWVGDKRLFCFKKSDETVEGILATAKQTRSQFGRVDLVMVDYLQIVETAKDFGGFREPQVSYIAKLLYQLGKQLNCPVIVPAQLNRNYNRNGQADIKWLRESAGIEQHADGIAIITWPEKDANGTAIKEREERPIMAWQVKKRGGEKRSCWMGFYAKCQTFTDMQVYDVGDTKAKKQARMEGQMTQLMGDKVKKL